MIFCYTEFLFARHSESDRTLISSRTSRSPIDTRRCFYVNTTSYDVVRRRIDVETTSWVFRKILFRNNQTKIPRKTNAVAPNLSNISGRKCLWWNSSYFSVTLKGLSASSIFSILARLLLLCKQSSIAWSRPIAKKDSGFIYSILL